MLGAVNLMKVRKCIFRAWVLGLSFLLAVGAPLGCLAKSYSGGGHSYSSHSSHSSSWGGNRSSSYKSGAGKSYSSGSSWSEPSRHSYTSGKSYSSASGSSFWSSWGGGSGSSASSRRSSSAGSFSFDTAAARASKEEASRQQYKRFQDSQAASAAPDRNALRAASGSSSSAPSGSSKPRRELVRSYVPDWGAISSRPRRIYNIFNPYWSRPVVIYQDPYSSLFWWWLLDRSLDERAWWAYHHRYDMDPARYQALVATNQQLEDRIAQLEAQPTPRDPAYAPSGVDRDLMYSDQYVSRAYSNRPSQLGVIAFWAIGIPAALGLSAFFIWLIWFKRWPTAA